MARSVSGEKTDKAATAGRVARRQQANRSALLSAAYALFAKRGLHATTIGDITGMADVATGSFYNYFSDKEDIFRAVIAAYVDPVGDEIDRAGRNTTDPRLRLVSGFRTTMLKGISEPLWGRLLLQMVYFAGAANVGLLPRAARDLEACFESGLLPRAAKTMHVLPALSGGLLATLIAIQEGHVGAGDIDDLAVVLMRTVGLDDATTRELLERAVAPGEGPA